VHGGFAGADIGIVRPQSERSGVARSARSARTMARPRSARPMTKEWWSSATQPSTRSSRARPRSIGRPRTEAPLATRWPWSSSERSATPTTATLGGARSSTRPGATCSPWPVGAAW